MHQQPVLTAVSKFGRKRDWLIRLFLGFRLILSVLDPRLTISTDKCNTNGLFPTHRTIAVEQIYCLIGNNM